VTCEVRQCPLRCPAAVAFSAIGHNSQTLKLRKAGVCRPSGTVSRGSDVAAATVPHPPHRERLIGRSIQRVAGLHRCAQHSNRAAPAFAHNNDPSRNFGGCPLLHKSTQTASFLEPNSLRAGPTPPASALVSHWDC
jgi:hypothetical protein